MLNRVRYYGANTIHEGCQTYGMSVLGNGTYKLRQQDGKVLKEIYNEGKLSNKPRTVG